MFAGIAPYFVSFSAMAFAALSAFTLITWVNRFDPPSAATQADSRRHTAAA